MLFSLPSFTAPETEVLQSFSGLDPRLKECLGISGYLQKSSMQEFAGRGCILRTFQHAVLKHSKIKYPKAKILLCSYTILA